VPSTKMNQWHLQCLYTRSALVSEGVPVYRAHVIHSRPPEKKGHEAECRIYELPEWCL
jgi:hypothetical protein